jgi:hypothetical protein
MIGVSQPTGSHRVLPAEITAFRYPGGVTDQVVERFNNFLKGEPWTPEIAAAANSFIDGQAGAASQMLNSGIDNTNKLYGTNVGTALKMKPSAQPVQKVAGPPAGATHTAMGSDGQKHYTNAQGQDLGVVLK